MSYEQDKLQPGERIVGQLPVEGSWVGDDEEYLITPEKAAQNFVDAGFTGRTSAELATTPGLVAIITNKPKTE